MKLTCLDEIQLEQVKALLEHFRNYQNEPKLNGVYPRNNLPKIRDGAYVINLDEFKSITTHRIALYVNNNNNNNNNNVTYFESFGVKHIPKEIKNFIGKKILSQIFIEYKHTIR